jgi:hypothetical protein
MSIESILIPDHIIKRISTDYLTAIYDAQKNMKIDINAYFEKLSLLAEGNDNDIKKLPHPLKIKRIGITPPHIEMQIVDDIESINLLMELLTNKNIELTILMNMLANKSSNYLGLLKQIDKEVGVTNQGGAKDSLFSHRFFAFGEHFYKLTNTLTAQIANNPIESHCPASYLIPKHPSQFFEVHADFCIQNNLTGQHQVEGFYINSYEYGSENEDGISKKKYIEMLDNNHPGNLANFLINKNMITNSDSPIHLLEIMMIGESKSYNLDDSTFNFMICFENGDTKIGDLIEAHIEYFTRINNLTAVLESKPMNHEETKSFKQCFEFVGKVLLYLNSGNKVSREENNTTEIKKSIKRSFSNPKVKNLKKELQRTCNKTILGDEAHTSKITN